MPKNQIVSIDIGTSAIKLVQLEQTPAGIRLVNAGVEPYVHTNPTAEIPIEVISETLQRLWRHVIGRSPTVVLSIPRLLVTSRRLTNLPAAATDEQLSNLVAMQAETELPFRVEGAIYDHHDAHRAEDGISVELIAARRETVQTADRLPQAPRNYTQGCDAFDPCNECVGRNSKRERQCVN